MKIINREQIVKLILNRIEPLITKLADDFEKSKNEVGSPRINPLTPFSYGFHTRRK
jgi:hypothetical protein